MKPALWVAAATFLAGSSLATAQNFIFEPFEFDQPDDSILAPIELSLEVVEDSGAIIFRIANDSTPGDDWVTSGIPTITNVYFEDSAGLLTAPTFLGGEGGTVLYQPAQTGGNLPGGTNIGFTSAFFFAADPPPTINGIDPGETGLFGATAPSLDAVVAALTNDTIRIGLHVQQIGDQDFSASYISRIPEPSTALLSLCALAGFTFIRRRR